MNKTTICVVLLCALFATTSLAQTLKDAQGHGDGLVNQERALLHDEIEMCYSDNDCRPPRMCFANVCIEGAEIDLAEEYLSDEGEGCFSDSDCGPLETCVEYVCLTDGETAQFEDFLSAFNGAGSHSLLAAAVAGGIAILGGIF